MALASGSQGAFELVWLFSYKSLTCLLNFLIRSSWYWQYQEISTPHFFVFIFFESSRNLHWGKSHHHFRRHASRPSSSRSYIDRRLSRGTSSLSLWGSFWRWGSSLRCGLVPLGDLVARGRFTWRSWHISDHAWRWIFHWPYLSRRPPLLVSLWCSQHQVVSLDAISRLAQGWYPFMEWWFTSLIHLTRFD